MESSPEAALGKFLTAAEGRGMAAMLESGQSMNKALNEVNHARRPEAKSLVAAAGLSHHNKELSVAVLKGIAGAKEVQRE